MTPHLARIDLYPLKSLDGVSVQTVEVLPSGALRHDRAYALMDAEGKFMNAKRDARIHRVRSRFSVDLTQVTLWSDTPLMSPATFALNPSQALAGWFSTYFQQPLKVAANAATGFPDDMNAPGPTVISTATLQTVADWYGLSLAETRRRFRTNLEIDGVPAFWEDRLISASGEPINFCIGKTTFQGINPCQRCVVPTRDTYTGEGTKDFQKRFIRQRETSLSETVARSRFNHFYRLAVNTRVLPDGGIYPISVSDPIHLL